MTYNFVRSWGQQGSAQGQFNNPIGIAIAGREIFISDTGNNRIQVFDLDGKFLRMFGGQGNGPGELDRPMHLDIHAGKLYVAEYLNDRIQVFSLDGTPWKLSALPVPGRNSLMRRVELLSTATIGCI
ncbi:6-bladed beta-propeller [Desulfomarina profundi]|nr:6-bladed beta-propeller [Desulfomarina profundi]